MIKVKKASTFTTKFRVIQNSEDTHEIGKNIWGTDYKYRIDDVLYTFRMVNMWDSTYELMKDDNVILTAKYKWGLIGRWIININGREFRWSKPGFFSSMMILNPGNDEKNLGLIIQTAFWGNEWELDFPAQAELWFQLALFCMYEKSSNEYIFFF